MRPRGILGEVAQAILAAAVDRPGTVADLAQRSSVGYDVAHYTVSRLLCSGHLVRLNGGRPAVLAPGQAEQPSAPALDSIAAHLDQLQRTLWEIAA